MFNSPTRVNCIAFLCESKHFFSMSALQDSIQRRNVDRMEKALEEAHNSKHTAALSFWIETAEKNLEELRKLKRYTHAILEMKQSTVSELHRYKMPVKCVYDVMRATYLMLGETIQDVEVIYFKDV